MKTTLQIFQLIVAILLVISVLLQSRGTGLSSVFGGSGSAIYRTKRGVEKYLFYSTIVLASLMVILTLISLIKF